MALLHPLTGTAYTRFTAAFQALGADSVLMATEGSLSRQHAAAFAHFIPLPSLDVDHGALLSLLRARGLHPDAVLAGCEYTVNLADALARACGCVHGGNPEPRSERDKRLMREAFARAGVPQPEVLATVGSPEALAALDLEALPYPVIIKPTDLAGSNFVRLCESAAEVRAFLPPILDCRSSPSSGAPWAGEALIERVAQGPEYSVEVVVQGGRVLAAWPTRKWVSAWPHCDEVAHLHGVTLPPEQQARVEAALRGVVDAWQLDCGVLHAELKISPSGEVSVIEVANRVAGEQISELVETSRGVSLELIYTRLRLGLDVAGLVQAGQEPPKTLHGVRFFFHPQGSADVAAPPGITLTHIGGDTSFPPLPGSHPGPQHACFRSGSWRFEATSLEAARQMLGQ